MDHRKGMISGVAFWVGVGCQNDLLFPELLSELGGGLLGNGITAGGIVAILMTLFLEATAPRRSRIEGQLDLSVLPKIREFSRYVSPPVTAGGRTWSTASMRPPRRRF